MNAEDLLLQGRAIVAFKGPYFASVLYGMVYVATNEIPTLGVSPNLVCYYNPKFIEKHVQEEVAGALVHEISHVLSRHFERFAGVTDQAEKQLANIGQDLAINPQLIASGWKLPSCALYPRMFNFPENLSAEEYFSRLKKLTPPPSMGGEGNGEGVCSGQCGGIAGNKNEVESGEGEPGGEGETSGRTEQEIDLILKKTARDIQEHASRGSIPKFLQEFAKLTLTPPKISWNRELASVFRSATGRIVSGGMDLSLRRPSKRSYLRDIPRPGLIQILPEVCLIRDTSGSMGHKQLQDATIEACGLMRSVGLDSAWFIDADTRASNIKRVRVQDIPNLPITGRGGTDFREPIERALKLRPRPNIIVYFTDGDGTTADFPPPGVDVIWCIIPSYYRKAPAEWGRAIIIEKDSTS